MDDKNKNIDEDMSNTFVADVNQKSAVAQNNEMAAESATGSAQEQIPGYEPTNSVYDVPKKKKTNPILIIFLMLLACGIGVGGSYYYFEIYNKDTKKEINAVDKVETKDKTTVKEEELNPDGIYVKNLIDRYDFSVISNVEVYDKLYGKEKTLVTELDDNYVRVLSAANVKKLGNVMLITSEAFHDSVVNLFGNQLNLADKNFSIGCDTYEYSQGTGYYEYKEGSGCGGASTVIMKQKIVKAIKTKDNIEVNVAVAILDGANQKVYKNYKIGDTSNSDLQEVEGVSADTFDIDKDYDKLNQYKYTFNYDNENNNYYLYSIELVK